MLIKSFFYILCGFVIVILGVMYISNGLYREFDYDEFEHIHTAWSLKKGNVLFKDTFEHHGPIYSYIVSNLWKVLNFKDQSDTLIKLRIFSLLLLGIFLILIFFFVRKLFDPLIALFVIILILCHKIIYIKSIEIRPDMLQSIFMYAGLFFLFKILQNEEKTLNYLFLGLFFSLTTLVNMKAGIIIAPTFLLFIVIISKEIRLKNLSALFSGICIGVVPVFAFFILNNALNEFIYYNCMYNFILFFTQNVSIIKMGSRINSNILFYILWFGLYCIGAYKLFKSSVEHRLKIFLLLNSVIFFLLSLLSFYDQWNLALIPFLSIIPGFGLSEILKLKIKLRSINILIVTVIIMAFASILVSYRDTFSIFIKNKIMRVEVSGSVNYIYSNEKQIEFTDYIDEHVGKDDHILTIWNNVGGYIFRPHLLYFWFINENQETVINNKSGYALLGDNLIRQLNSKKCRYVILDNDVQLLKDKHYRSYVYILNNYKSDERYPYFLVRRMSFTDH